MPKKKPPPGVVRLTLELSTEQHQRLDALAEKVGAESIGRVFAEALRLYEFLGAELDPGDLITIDKTGVKLTPFVRG